MAAFNNNPHTQTRKNRDKKELIRVWMEEVLMSLDLPAQPDPEDQPGVTAASQEVTQEEQKNTNPKKKN
jgi:hypothetical protein